MGYADNFVKSRKSLRRLGKVLSNVTLSTPGLAIKAGGGVLVKAGTAFRALVQGKLVSVGANTDWAALSGTVVNATFNVFVFLLAADGTKYTVMGTAGATLGAVVMPDLSSATYENCAVVGLLIINPTGSGNFVGNTTALDDATVVPNAVYINTPFPIGLDLGLLAD